MDIAFENPSHERLVNDYDALSRKFDRRHGGAADDILVAMNVLAAAPSLADVPRTFHPHPLKGDRKGTFAVDVNKTHRVIFRPDHDGDEHFRIDNYKTITSIRIIEIFKDYH
jgi:plasmid maintenance system killer protein